MKALKPVVKASAEAQAVAALRGHVLSGAAGPGQRLTETDLAARLAVSRGTVRTALHQLCIEGLIHQIPYTGWQVAAISSRDAWELYELRSSLEALAARLAAERKASQSRTSLQGALRRLEHACGGSDRQEIAEADFDLHRTIIKLAEHRRLLTHYELIAQQTRLYIHSSNSLIEEPNLILAQHVPIVDAILAGDALRAASLSETHNVQEGEKLVRHLRIKEEEGA